MDFTVYNPSLAWGAGNLISDLADLERFFRALLGGRLLPPRLLAAMTTPVNTGMPGYGYGLGLEMIDTPSGRLLGHGGAIPGFDNIVLNTKDGRHQLGVMINELAAPPAVLEALTRAWMAITARLLEGAPVGGGSTSSSFRAAVQIGESARTAEVLAQAGMAVQARH